MAAAKQLAPFRQGTRKRRQYLTTYNYTGTTAGQRPTPFTLPQTGFLSRILLVAHGTVSVSGGSNVLGVDGLAGLFNRITVSMNLGSASVFDASGPGAETAARWENAFAADGSPIGLTNADQTYLYALPINIAMNRKKQFYYGLVNLQDPQVQVQLSMVFNPLTSVLSNAVSGSNSSINIDVYMEYFELPDPTVFAYPPRALVRTLEEQFPTAPIVGQNIYTVPRLGVMTNFGIIGYANGARVTPAQMQEIDIRLNKTDTIEQRSGLLQALLDGTDYGLVEGSVPGTAAMARLTAYGPQQTGVFSWYGWNATDVPDNGDFRDALDTLEVTTTEILATYASGTTVTSTDTIRVVRRVLQVLG